MKIRNFVAALALLTAGCADPEAARRLEADIESMNERIKQAQEELNTYGKGTVEHDLIALRIAIHQQTLAMLEQRRAAQQWRTTLIYSVDGQPYAAPADLAPADDLLAAWDRVYREVAARLDPIFAPQVTGIRLSGVDVMSHAHWGAADPARPASRREGDAERLEAAYREVDEAVGRAREQLRPGDLLLIPSNVHHDMTALTDLEAWETRGMEGPDGWEEFSVRITPDGD